jgi:hypothetical protein
MTELPNLTKRKRQDQVIGPIYAGIVEQLGEVRVGVILRLLCHPGLHLAQLDFCAD